MITTTIASLVLALPPAVQHPTEPDRPITPTETAEDLEVMRRILVDALDDELAREEPEGPGVSWSKGATVLESYRFEVFSGGSSSRVRHSRAFHVPGAGAFFAIDVAAPLREVEPAEAEEGEPSEGDDVWEETRRELHGRGSARGRLRGNGDSESRGTGGLFAPLARLDAKSWELDPEALDAITQAVVRTVARHADRIRGLGRDADVVVALHVSPGKLLPAAGTYTLRSETEDGGPGIWQLAAPRILGAEVVPVNLVVRVPLGLSRAYLDDRVGEDELGRRATVTRYRAR